MFGTLILTIIPSIAESRLSIVFIIALVLVVFFARHGVFSKKIIVLSSHVKEH